MHRTSVSADGFMATVGRTAGYDHDVLAVADAMIGSQSLETVLQRAARAWAAIDCAPPAIVSLGRAVYPFGPEVGESVIVVSGSWNPLRLGDRLAWRSDVEDAVDQLATALDQTTALITWAPAASITYLTKEPLRGPHRQASH